MPLDSKEQTLTDIPRLVPRPPSILAASMQAGMANCMASLSPQQGSCIAVIVLGGPIPHHRQPSLHGCECAEATQWREEKSFRERAGAKGH